MAEIDKIGIGMKWMIFFIGMTLISSCSSGVVYSKKIKIEHSSWYDQEELLFEFEMNDTSSFYELDLDIEHAVNYGFENVYLKIKTIFPNDSIVEEPLSLELADKAGQWYGDCNSTHCINKIILQDKTLFRPAGLYRIAFNPYNREDPILGIKSLKLSVKKIN